MPVVFDGFDELAANADRELGVSAWATVDQGCIDGFADSTGDHAWIHVDPGRAAAGPFGATIAHGPLVLSLITSLAGEVIHVRGLRLALHYGYDRVRFIQPVSVGSSIRARVRLARVGGTAQGARAHYHVDVERDGNDGPVCAADLIYFYVFDPRS